jgi:hypothetical protein
MFIGDALGRGRSATAIWEDPVDNYGFTARYASVKRFALKLRDATTPEARAIIVTALRGRVSSEGTGAGAYAVGPSCYRAR